MGSWLPPFRSMKSFGAVGVAAPAAAIGCRIHATAATRARAALGVGLALACLSFCETPQALGYGGCSAGRVLGKRRANPALGLEQPVRAALLVVVEDLAVVAAHAFGEHDLALADRPPLAGLLAKPALAAFRPALDLEHGGQRYEPERSTERAEKPTVEVAHEHSRNEQHAHADPQRNRPLAAEEPEGLDVPVEQVVVGREEVAHGGEQHHVLDEAQPPLERLRHRDPP